MRLLLVIFFFFLISIDMRAQSGNVRFYDHSDGLESMWVGSVQAHRGGEIWMISNDDLIYYNGYEKKILNLSGPDNNPVYVNTVAVGDEEIWVGTQEELRRYDPITQEQLHFEIGAIATMHLDATGILWAESEKGLIKIETENQISYLQDSTEWGTIDVFDFQNDGNGTLWIATTNQGLLTYDIFTSSFKPIEGLVNVGGQPQLEMRDLLLDKDESIWVGSSGGGLYHLEGEQVTQFLPSDKPGSISTTEAYTLEQDMEGNLWIGTWAGGLNFYDKATDQFTNYQAGKNQSSGLPSNVIIDLHIQDNKLWLGTAYSGLWMTDLSDRAFTWWTKDAAPVPLKHNNFWAIHHDTENNLWLGSYQGGLYKISEKYELIHYAPFEGIPANTVWSIFENETGLWFGTHKGLLLQRKGSEQMIHYSTESNTPEGWKANNVFMVVGNDKLLYLGIWGSGVYEFDIEQNKIRQILNTHNVSDLELTTDGILWIAVNAQLLTYHPVNHTEAQPVNSPLKAPSITTLFEASDGLWIGSKEGLYHHESGQFKRIDHELLLEVNNPIEAQDSTLWMITSAGLVRISKDRTNIQLIPEQDRSLTESTNARALTRSNDGVLYFGGTSGIISFDPLTIRSNAQLPVLRIDEFKIGNEQIQNIEGKVPNHSSSISLSHKDLVFSFDFSAFDFTHPDELNYAYQLSGLSDEWIFTGAHNRRASFAGLASGDYQFQVKAKKTGGEWGPTKTVDIYMAPPWWKTNAALALYFLGTCLLVISVHRMRLQGLRRNEKKLKTEIARQTNRLQENNKELAVKNKELKSLSKFKEGLTHMIVHDMKNPLNAVIGLTEGKPSSENLNQIRQSGQTILQMITNMLDIQKFEEVEIQVNPTTINLYSLVAEAAREVSMLLETRGIILRNNVSTDFSVFIDHDIILRVFINLFTNAIKYSSSGSQITVDSTLIEDRVLIDVTDPGIGISKEAIPNIFNKFWQYKARKSGEISSTGLGLTYSKLAIESHKGKISVTSEVGKGSTFHFDLPYHGKSGEVIVPDEDELQYNYSDLAKRKIQALSIMIKDIPLYNVGKIMKILNEEDQEQDAEVQKWKSSVLDATYQHDQQRFKELTSI